MLITLGLHFLLVLIVIEHWNWRVQSHVEHVLLDFLWSNYGVLCFIKIRRSPL